MPELSAQGCQTFVTSPESPCTSLSSNQHPQLRRQNTGPDLRGNYLGPAYHSTTDQRNGSLQSFHGLSGSRCVLIPPIRGAEFWAFVRRQAEAQVIHHRQRASFLLAYRVSLHRSAGRQLATLGCRMRAGLGPGTVSKEIGRAHV